MQTWEAINACEQSIFSLKYIFVGLGAGLMPVSSTAGIEPNHSGAGTCGTTIIRLQVWECQVAAPPEDP